MIANLNQQCTVILRRPGIEALEKYYRDLGLKPPKMYALGDEYTGALWEIMNVFGPFTYIGAPTPFDTTIELKPLID